MPDDNPTKKQHYLPQFYLKRFSDSKGLLYYYDKRVDYISSPKSYSSVGYKHYFYAAETGISDKISQEVERWLKTYEDIISKELTKVIDKILNNEHISEDDKYILAALMCMLWLRTPSMRQSMNQRREDLVKQVLQFGAAQSVDNFIKSSSRKVTDAQRDNLVNMLRTGKFDMTFNNIHHLKFMTENFGFNDKGFTNMFYGHKWKIYINKGRKKFITAENPVVEWWLPPETFWGCGFLERTKFFPLTPDIFIVLIEPKGSHKVNRKTLYDEDEKLVKELNLLIGSRKSNYVYASNKDLLKEIILSRKNPGPFEREFYMKYDYPWDQFRKKQSIE
ncbi:DUF4238 domain-containing protein [Patescibacteria group bacterium]|nr:DUF4238 domain-containing protein [Patescibacteria group bacterium]